MKVYVILRYYNNGLEGKFHTEFAGYFMDVAFTKKAAKKKIKNFYKGFFRKEDNPKWDKDHSCFGYGYDKEKTEKHDYYYITESELLGT